MYLYNVCIYSLGCRKGQPRVSERFLFYFFFEQEGTFHISGEIEVFDIDKHIRLIERGNICKVQY